MDKDNLISMWMASLGEDADDLDKRFIHTITNLIIYAYEKGVENGKKTCGVQNAGGNSLKAAPSFKLVGLVNHLPTMYKILYVTLKYDKL